MWNRRPLHRLRSTRWRWHRRVRARMGPRFARAQHPYLGKSRCGCLPACLSCSVSPVFFSARLTAPLRRTLRPARRVCAKTARIRRTRKKRALVAATRESKTGGLTHPHQPPGRKQRQLPKRPRVRRERQATRLLLRPRRLQGVAPARFGGTRAARFTTALATSTTGLPNTASTCPNLTPKPGVSTLNTARHALDGRATVHVLAWLLRQAQPVCLQTIGFSGGGLQLSRFLHFSIASRAQT